MAGTYRALLIGNSVYPADEHNLQPLKGPPKDISALNRALIDDDTGLFADTEVTLLPEASSVRALRALSRFFGGAQRDDVVLLYFSGHGKLDQLGRLYLCMQDTDAGDLLATSISSVRINEFADASRARNVVIVLDCCHAGAFRGADLANPVSGPGRYVLTSCRGTQLANDATVENGTSRFTQVLVDAMLGGAPDHDADGYVSFSDVYAYVDRRLRQEGRQIPQRRVDGDGDVALARRPGGLGSPPLPLRPEDAARPPVPGPPTADPSGPVRPWQRPARVLGVVAVALCLTGLAVVLLKLAGPGPAASAGPDPLAGTITQASPWRIQLDEDPNHPITPDPGCSVTVMDPQGNRQTVLSAVYAPAAAQVHQTGTIHWSVNQPNCLVAALRGPGALTLPASVTPTIGDTDAFTAPKRVAVTAMFGYTGERCTIKLMNVTDGVLIDYRDVHEGTGAEQSVVLDPGSATLVYLHPDGCGVRIAALP